MTTENQAPEGAPALPAAASPFCVARVEVRGTRQELPITGIYDGTVYVHLESAPISSGGLLERVTTLREKAVRDGRQFSVEVLDEVLSALAAQPKEWAASDIVASKMIGAQAPAEGAEVARLDWDSMCEAFSRVIEAHADKASPFHNPINADATLALRELRGAVPTIKATHPQPKGMAAPESAREALKRGALVEAVARAIAFADSGSTEDWEGCRDLAEAAIRVCDARNPPRCSYCHASTSQPVEAPAVKAEPIPDLTPEQLADKCEAWLRTVGASNIVDAYEAGYRDCEAAHAAIGAPPPTRKPDYPGEVIDPEDTARLGKLFEGKTVEGVLASLSKPPVHGTGEQS